MPLNDEPHRLPPINMTDTISYAGQGPYIPPPYYQQNHPQVPPGPGPLRQESTAPRKRPKYTRSKTGCLTCRVKKIKCDETKPNCMRCTHGQRDCTWPEGVPARKKPTPRKDTVDGQPSNAESSGLSEASTPPTRDNTPPKRHGPQVDYGIPSMISRRQSEPYPSPIASDHDLARRPIPQQGYPMQLHSHQHNQNSHSNNILSVIPELSPYPSTQQPRYDQTSYINPPLHSVSSRGQPTQHSLGIRQLAHPSPPTLHSWNTASSMVSDPLEPYFSTVHERNLVGHSSSSNDQHARYQ